MEKLDNIGLNGLVFTEGLVQHPPMFIGWLTCIPAVLLPHSPCRSTTANAPANRQMPIALVVTKHAKKKRNDQHGHKLMHYFSLEA